MAEAKLPEAKFLAFQSCVDPSFWSRFGKEKVEKFQLNQDAVPLRCSVTHGQKRKGTSLPCRVFLDQTSLNLDSKPEMHYYHVPGSLLNVNKKEGFRDLDKNATLCGVAQQILDIMNDGSFLKSPNDLFRFIVISFADLKKYSFVYWFGFPCILPHSLSVTIQSQKLLADDVNMEVVSETWASFSAKNRGILCFWVDRSEECGFHLLEELEDDASQVRAFCIVDCSANARYPCWNVRNYIAAISNHFGLERVPIWCLRHLESTLQSSISFIYRVQGAKLPEDASKCKIRGWEKNAQKKVGPRMMDLKSQLDPEELMTQSMDLNLNLMRWRQLPSLQLNVIRETSCLLLGSGTLGCNVARNLMGWGFRKITFVDNGRVSYSNPARQSLYTFEDCMNGGKWKAEAAAMRMKQIYPKIDARGVVMTIPMPGHNIPEEARGKVREDYEKLHALVKEHDVTFLLTDSRESRWLPTVLTQAENKLCINVALGFDTYVVLRHGVHGVEDRLGCYFCTDIVAPRDSLSDRSLDQQCTVTRPGLAPIASALGVELLVALLHTEEKQRRKADFAQPMTKGLDNRLGLLPHQIRGYLTHFNNMLMKAPAFDKCPGCADVILKQLAERGWDFILQACNSPQYLEEVTGLDKLYEDAPDIDWDIDDSDEDGTFV